MATLASGDDSVSHVSSAKSHMDNSKANRSLLHKHKKHDSSRHKNSSLLKAANRSVVCAKLQTVNRELANGYQFFKVRCEQLDTQVIELAEQCRVLTTENSQLADLVETLLTQRCIDMEKQSRLLAGHANAYRRLVPQRANYIDKLLDRHAEATLHDRAGARDSVWPPTAGPEASISRNAAQDYESANISERYDSDAEAPTKESGAPNRLSFVYRPAGRAPPPLLATDPTLSTIEASTNDYDVTTQNANYSVNVSSMGSHPSVPVGHGTLLKSGLTQIAESTNTYAETVPRNADLVQNRSSSFTQMTDQAIVSSNLLNCTENPSDVDLVAASSKIRVTESAGTTNSVAIESDDVPVDKVKRMRRYSSLLNAVPLASEKSVEVNDLGEVEELTDPKAEAVGKTNSNEDTMILSGFGLADGRQYAGPANGSKFHGHDHSHRYRKRSKGVKGSSSSLSTKVSSQHVPPSTNSVDSTASSTTKANDNDNGAQSKPGSRRLSAIDSHKRRRKQEKEPKIKAVSKRYSKGSTASIDSKVTTAGTDNNDVYSDFMFTTNEDDRLHSAIIARARQNQVASVASSRRTSICEVMSLETAGSGATGDKASTTHDAPAKSIEKQSVPTPESLLDAMMVNIEKRRMQKTRHVRTDVANANPAGAAEPQKRAPLSDVQPNDKENTNAKLDRSLILSGSTRRRSRMQQVAMAVNPISCNKSEEKLATDCDKIVDELLSQPVIKVNENNSPSNIENCGLRRSKRTSIQNRSYAETDWTATTTTRKARRGETSYVASEGR